MSNSKLIELSYYDPAVQVRLSAYADTVVLDHNEKGSVICAIRFDGYLRETFPELRYDQNKAREVFLAWIKNFEEGEGGASC